VAVVEVAAVVGAAACLVLLIVAARGERRRAVRFKTRRGVLRTMLLVGALAMATLALAPQRDGAQREEGSDPSAPPVTSAQEPAPDGGGSWLSVVVLASGVVAVLGYGLWRSRPRAPLDDVDGPSRMAMPPGADLFDASLDDLEAEPDPRVAIIAAYARLLDGLDRLGLGRQVGEAPVEHLTRALRSLRVPPRPLERLVALFAEARFSQHPLTASHKAQAIAAFRAARAALLETAPA
jgi:hypothetical protein